jgi:hypothetical protein
VFSRALHSTLVLNLSSLQTLAVTLVIAIISERRDTESAGLTVRPVIARKAAPDNDLREKGR